MVCRQCVLALPDDALTMEYPIFLQSTSTMHTPKFIEKYSGNIHFPNEGLAKSFGLTPATSCTSRSPPPEFYARSLLETVVPSISRRTVVEALRLAYVTVWYSQAPVFSPSLPTFMRTNTILLTLVQ